MAMIGHAKTHITRGGQKSNMTLEAEGEDSANAEVRRRIPEPSVRELGSV